MKLVVDGKLVEFGNDLSGQKVEPFVIKGTTYLPIRAVGEAMGKKVHWEGKTQTAYIGEVPGVPQYLTETLDVVPTNWTYFDVHRLDDSSKFEMGGKKYNTGYRLNTTEMYFNLNGQYTQIVGDIGGLGDSNKLNVYLDDQLYTTIDVHWKKPIEKINIPVAGVNQIKFQLETQYPIGFGDFIIK